MQYSGGNSRANVGQHQAIDAEAGVAPMAIVSAVNDSLAPLDARVTAQPITPERVLKALGVV